VNAVFGRGLLVIQQSGFSGITNTYNLKLPGVHPKSTKADAGSGFRQPSTFSSGNASYDRGRLSVCIRQKTLATTAFSCCGWI
jgi:hypothetical protein